MAASKEAAAQEETAEATEKESKKAPKPEGFVSPIDYAEHRSQVQGKFVRPQTIYGYIRNNTEGDNPFPVEKNSDGRWMINQAAADAWFEARSKAREAKKAEKAAKEKADKEAAAAD